MTRLAERGIRIEIAEVNLQPGASAIDATGRPVAVMALDIVDGQIQAIHSVAKADELRHLDVHVR